MNPNKKQITTEHITLIQVKPIAFKLLGVRKMWKKACMILLILGKIKSFWYILDIIIHKKSTNKTALTESVDETILLLVVERLIWNFTSNCFTKTKFNHFIKIESNCGLIIFIYS